MVRRCVSDLETRDLKRYVLFTRTRRGLQSFGIAGRGGSFIFRVAMVRYTKPSLTFEQQADQLLARGMVGNRATMISRLSFVNYYRLSGYWWPYRKRMPAAKTPGSRQLEQRQDYFVPGAEFETVWDHYVFDQRLRLHVMEAIERIEVAARTQLAYHHSRKWGADAYAMNQASLPRLTTGPISDRKSHAAFVAKIGEQLEQGKNQPFVHHFRTKYTSSAHLPIWMAVELMSIGSVATMYHGCLDDVQELVARPFGRHRDCAQARGRARREGARDRDDLHAHGADEHARARAQREARILRGAAGRSGTGSSA